MRFYFALLVFFCTISIGYAQPAGSMDTGFGNNGFLDIGPGGRKLTELPDKRVLLVNSLGITRLNALDYSVDSSFADNGFIKKVGNFFPLFYDLLPDGSIVVLFEYPVQGGHSFTEIKVARFSTDGIQDMDYGDNGYASIAFQANGYLRDMLAHPNGSIFITGWAGSQIFQDGSIFTIHIGPEGQLTYPGNGIRIENLGLFDYTGLGNALDILPDGKVVLGGQILPENTFTESSMYMLCYEENGQPAFLVPGWPINDNVGGFSYIQDVKVGPDGKIYVAADMDNASSLVIRYNLDGTRDNTFGTQGVNIQDFVRGKSLLFQPDGKVIVSGRINDPNAPIPMVRRVKANGTKDNTFSGDGMFFIEQDSLFNFDGSMTLLSSGKLLMGLKSYTTTYLVRLHLGLIVAAGEPFAPSVKVAALHPNVFREHAPLRVHYPSDGNIDPVAIVVGANGIVATTSIIPSSGGYLEADMPVQLSLGTYQLLFMDGDEAVRAQFVKVD
jgi:uncharacterized delta-60 repeat protein